MEHDNLRVKFSRGDMVIELEGEVKTVLAELNALKHGGTGKLVGFFSMRPTPVAPPPVPLAPLADEVKQTEKPIERPVEKPSRKHIKIVAPKAKQKPGRPARKKIVQPEPVVAKEPEEPEKPEAPIAKEEEFEGIGFPSLERLVEGNIPQSELEWICIYSFSASEGGGKPFSRADLIRLYRVTQRIGGNRIANLSTNLKLLIEKKWIAATVKGDYRMLPDGIACAKEVISRTGAPTAPAHKAASARKKRGQKPGMKRKTSKKTKK